MSKSSLNDFHLISYCDTGAKNYRYWITVKIDNKHNLTRKGVLKFVQKYFEPIFGLLGQKWQYENLNPLLILKVNDNSNFLFFIMKYQNN
jgi:hypothetical protein